MVTVSSDVFIEFAQKQSSWIHMKFLTVEGYIGVRM